MQARLWVQVIRQLRNGVKLKSNAERTRKPIEYEMTPYEMMMDDIRSRRYKLRAVTVDGQIPLRVKKDAHAVILEFIRSRPPLRKVNDDDDDDDDPLSFLEFFIHNLKFVFVIYYILFFFIYYCQ